MERLIIFLIRRKLGLKKNEQFKFDNQRPEKKDVYYFTSTRLMKIVNGNGRVKESNVRLNWLVNKDCKIIKIK